MSVMCYVSHHTVIKKKENFISMSIKYTLYLSDSHLSLITFMLTHKSKCSNRFVLVTYWLTRISHLPQIHFFSDFLDNDLDLYHY